MVKVTPELRDAALERLLAVNGVTDKAHVVRFLDFSKSNKIDLQHMWALQHDDGRVLQTVLAVPSPGRTAMFFASHPTDRSEMRSIGRLIAHAGDAMAACDIHLGQALLEPAEALERETFVMGGFTELAHLSYMERSLPRRLGPTSDALPADVTLTPYDDSREDDVLHILEASYEDTLDCPDLRGLRETRDILLGHRSTGEFDPNLWTLLYLDDIPSGAILLNPSTTQKSVELVYIGLSRPARGRGLGRALLRHGVSLAVKRAHRMISLAVDERNTPAIKLYTAERFRRALRRVAMIRPLRAVSHARES